MQFLDNSFLRIVREKFNPDFYPQETNFETLGKNRSNRILINIFFSFFCSYNFNLSLAICQLLTISHKMLETKLRNQVDLDKTREL